MIIKKCYLFVRLSISECSGIQCYNGGSLSFENGRCVCDCPPNTTGLLCGQGKITFT